MGKPQAVRVPSDECVVLVGGTEYHPHEGEWVELVPGLRAADYILSIELSTVRSDLKAAEGDSGREAIERQNALLRRYYESASELLARRVRAWSWTDDYGQPLPQPDGTPAPFLALRPDELGYLIAVARETTQAQRKNA